ncbi:hypothetical protein GCM10009828_080250 [Actinoplanes couchii]|uniref:Uncharacterized protein n=1 Tax=Actinoplanes couchii TaxID=403638 RepID=A0ABQ3XK48_9ACTN|nr:hypothetical protein Aco03nite_072760 [Actinoplanes couchii]
MTDRILPNQSDPVIKHRIPVSGGKEPDPVLGPPSNKPKPMPNISNNPIHIEHRNRRLSHARLRPLRPRLVQVLPWR